MPRFGVVVRIVGRRAAVPIDGCRQRGPPQILRVLIILRIAADFKYDRWRFVQAHLGSMICGNRHARRYAVVPRGWLERAAVRGNGQRSLRRRFERLGRLERDKLVAGQIRDDGDQHVSSSRDVRGIDSLDADPVHLDRQRHQLALEGAPSRRETHMNVLRDSRDAARARRSPAVPSPGRPRRVVGSMTPTSSGKLALGKPVALPEDAAGKSSDRRRPCAQLAGPGARGRMHASRPEPDARVDRSGPPRSNGSGS